MIYSRIQKFYRSYKGKKCVIGYSLCNREIYAIHVGDSYGKQFIAVYAVHGREWVTSLLALKHIKRRVHFGGWIVPLANPDGAVISQTSSPLWKANARGVDINVNFDAGWGEGVKNVRVRGAENCIGDRPHSEPETRALAEFTKRISPAVTLSFHTKGGEIYYEYGGAGDLRGARIIANSTGYAVKKIAGSHGGYKDWCISALKIPAYTVECGDDSLAHPVTKVRKIRECYSLLEDFTKYYEK